MFQKWSHFFWFWKFRLPTVMWDCQKGGKSSSTDSWGPDGIQVMTLVTF